MPPREQKICHSLKRKGRVKMEGEGVRVEKGERGSDGGRSREGVRVEEGERGGDGGKRGKRE